MKAFRASLVSLCPRSSLGCPYSVLKSQCVFVIAIARLVILECLCSLPLAMLQQMPLQKGQRCIIEAHRVLQPLRMAAQALMQLQKQGPCRPRGCQSVMMQSHQQHSHPHPRLHLNHIPTISAVRTKQPSFSSYFNKHCHTCSG